MAERNDTWINCRTSGPDASRKSNCGVTRAFALEMPTPLARLPLLREPVLFTTSTRHEPSGVGHPNCSAKYARHVPAIACTRFNCIALGHCLHHRPAVHSPSSLPPQWQRLRPPPRQGIAATSRPRSSSRSWDSTSAHRLMLLR
jgi:hypothetical protein